MDQKIGRFSIKTISHTRGQRQRLLSHLHRFSLTYHNFITPIHSFFYNTQNSFCNFDLQTGKNIRGFFFLVQIHLPFQPSRQNRDHSSFIQSKSLGSDSSSPLFKKKWCAWFLVLVVSSKGTTRDAVKSQGTQTDLKSYKLTNLGFDFRVI